MSLTDKRPRMPVHLEKDVGLKFTAALFTFILAPWNLVIQRGIWGLRCLTPAHLCEWA